MRTLTFIISILLTAQVLFGQYKIDTSFYSESLGEVKMVDVYFPPGYNENPDLYYPVVYYLHGWHADQNDLGSMISWVTYLINNDIIEPCLMVAADNSPDPFDGSCYVNSSLWGNYEDYMVNDLVSWVENSFRAVPQKDYRSLMGHSMGGVGSFRLGLLHPETYCAFAAHAAEVNVDLFVEDIRQELLSENSGPPYSYSWEGGGFFTQWMFLAGGAFTPNSNTPQTYIDPPIVEFPFDENCNLIDSVYQKWQLFDVPAILHDISPDDSVGIFYSCGMNDFLHIYPANLALKDTLDALGFQSVFLPHDGDHVMPPEFKQEGLKFLDSIMGSPLVIPGEPGIIHVPGDYPTIQQGIDAANNYDTVLVSDGTYYEQINFLGKKPLMVASEFIIDGDTNHIANTVIDGSQLTNLDSASVVYFISGEDTTSVLCGFTIQNGKGTYIPDDMGDWDSRVGGGIWIAGAGAKIIHNRITHNTLDDTQDAIVTNVNGAGIGTPYEDANFWLVIADNTIDSNNCISNHYQASGAGICTSYSSRLINNVISYNICTGQLGAGTIGGGISLAGEFWTTPLIMIAEHNTITHNISQSESMANSAGVLAQVAQVKFSGNEVSENSVIDGLGIEFSGGGGMFLLNPQMGSVVTNNVFRGNTSNQLAGGVHLKNFDPEYIPVLFEKNYFVDNEAKYGGAVSSLDVPVILQNNVFTGNFASSKGGVAYIWKTDTNPDEHLASLINNTFSNNHADTTGGAIYSYGGNPVVFNSVFWQNPDMNGNEIASESGFAEIAYSDIDTNLISGEKMVGEGIIFLDPVFGDPDLLTLSELSPCINKATEVFTCQCGTSFPCPEQDIIGVLRPQNGLVDMGAYETILQGIWDHPLNNTGLRHSLNPNPFTGRAKLSYELDSKTKVEINLYNGSGELIKTLFSEQQEAGKHELQFSSGNLPAGIYFYRITTDSKQATGRMVLLK